MADAAIALRVRIKPDEVETVETRSYPAQAYPGACLPTAKLALIANQVVGEAFAVETLLLRGRRRGARRLAHARTIAMALVHMVCGRSQTDVARCFSGRNRTTASNHMENIEALNDAPEHEAFWNLLERKFTLLVEYASLPSSRQAWADALQGLERGLDDGALEGDAVDQARHVTGVFWEDRIRRE